jgi:predicted permease
MARVAGEWGHQGAIATAGASGTYVVNMGFKPVLRRLVRMPLFTGLTIVTLGLGIGANVAIFSVLEGVLLKPLPYPGADQLVAISHAAPGVNLTDAGTAPFLHFTYREEARTFQDVGMWRNDTFSVTGLAQPEEVRGIVMTGGVLPILGVQPALGRGFSEKDDAPKGPATVILTHAFWMSKFGGDPSAIGRSLTLDGQPREIIGVLPAGFRFLDLDPALIVPMQLDRSKTFLGNFSYQGLARLKPGATMEQATADAARLIPISLGRFPAYPGFSPKMFEQAHLAPSFQPLKESVVGNVSTVLWVLLGTVGLVLLIACANVANLLLVRVEGRQHELAIRAALGANRGQLARELLMESVTLAVLGGLLGLGLAGAGLKVLSTLAPTNLPRLDQITMDGTVLLFTLAISLLAGALFGAVPVMKYAGPQINTALRSEGRAVSASRERHRARNALVIVQVALTLVLLISSGLMIRTFQAMKHVQPGFTGPESLQTVRLSIPTSKDSEVEPAVRQQQAIAEKLAALPGVSSVAMTSTLPMEGQGWHDPIFAEDHVYAQGQIPPLRFFKFSSPGLLKTMGTPLLAGRDFTWTDVYEKRPVLMVTENLARELWHDPAAALGKRVRENLNGRWREVIGVVADEREDGVDQKAPTMAIWPILMEDFEGNKIFGRNCLAFVIRSPRAGTQAFLNEVSQAVWSVNPNLPLASVRTMEDIGRRSMARTSFTLVMLGIAGGMALLLGLAGIYGVISYSVSQRTREIGIRVALGAQHSEVTGMFVRHGAILAAIGIACGLTAAFALTRFMTTMLFEVSPLDPLTYAGVSIGLVAAAVLASYIPALRATAVDPIEALRAE